MYIILFAALIISSIAYLPTTFLIARPMMRRGYIGWGVLTGLIVLIIGLLFANYALAISQYKTFSKYGPCGICYEWGFVPVLMLWGGWAIGAVVFLIHNLTSGYRLYAIESVNLMKWPKALGYWILGSILIISIIFIGEQIWLFKQRIKVVNQISGISTQITGENKLAEIEIFPVMPPLLLPTSNNYIEENGLQFSPDGNWLFLKLPHDLEIWNFKTLLKHHTFNNLEYSDGLFAVSPNSKFIALELEERLSLYEIETMKLIWQTPSVWGTIGEMRFSEDGSQLIFIWGKKLFRLNTTTGEVTQEMEIAFFKDGYNFILNKNGNYFVGYHEGIIYFFDGITGKQLRSGDHCAEGFLTFLPNDDLLCWSYQSGIYQLYIWDNSGSLKKATDYPVSHWPGMLTYSPDSQMTILSDNSAGTNLLNLFKDTTQELLLDRAVTAAAFSVDNHVLVIATADGYLRFFAQTPVEK